MRVSVNLWCLRMSGTRWKDFRYDAVFVPAKPVETDQGRYVAITQA